MKTYLVTAVKYLAVHFNVTVDESILENKITGSGKLLLKSTWLAFFPGPSGLISWNWSTVLDYFLKHVTLVTGFFLLIDCFVNNRLLFVVYFSWLTSSITDHYLPCQLHVECHFHFAKEVIVKVKYKLLIGSSAVE